MELSTDEARTKEAAGIGGKGIRRCDIWLNDDVSHDAWEQVN